MVVYFSVRKARQTRGDGIMRSFSVAAFGAVLTFSALATAAGGEEEVQRQMKNLMSKDPVARKDAADAIGKIAQVKVSVTKPALPLLLETLNDPESKVRSASAAALSKLDEPSTVVPALIRVLQEDKENSVRASAATGLGLIGEPAKEALKPLRDLVKELKDGKADDQKRLVRAANEAIRQIQGMQRKK
jgi:HEAT repeat protein